MRALDVDGLDGVVLAQVWVIVVELHPTGWFMCQASPGGWRDWEGAGDGERVEV
jgi:hypothetical protein